MIKVRYWLPLLLMLSLAGCGDGRPAAATTSDPQGEAATAVLPEKLRVGFISPNNKKFLTGPEGWAQREGLLETQLRRYGVSEIEITNFPNGPNLNEALAAGSLDLGILGDTPAINARSAGLQTRVINQTQAGSNVWLVTQPDGPNSLADLKGQSVATAQGSYMSRYLIGLLAETGLDQEVRVLHLLPPDGEPALRRGDIAAYAYPTGFGPHVVNKGFRVLDEAVRHPNLRGSSVTVAREAFLNQYPHFAGIWNDIRAQAIRDIHQNNQESYFQFLAEVSEFPIDVVKASFPLENFSEQPFTAEGIQLLEEGKRFLVAHGLARRDFELRDWIISPD